MFIVTTENLCADMGQIVSLDHDELDGQREETKACTAVIYRRILPIAAWATNQCWLCLAIQVVLLGAPMSVETSW